MRKMCDCYRLLYFQHHMTASCLETTSSPHNLGAIRDSGSSSISGRRAILQNCAPDRRSHPAAGPFLGVGVLLEVMDRVAVVQTPDTIHQLTVVLERCQLPT